MNTENINLPLSIIKDSKVIDQNDFDNLASISDELKNTFLKSQVFRTRTEAEISVLNDLKHPTPASKYWQALREQGIMFHELVMLSYEYRKVLIEIKKLDRKILVEQDDLEKELLIIEREKKEFESKNMEKIAKDRIREIEMWSDIKTREAESMSEYELEDVDNHQLVSYARRFIKQRIAMADSGSPSERHNLIGQLSSAIRACSERNLLDMVLLDFPQNVKQNVMEIVEKKKMIE